MSSGTHNPAPARALVTGAGGFAGGHLIDLLLKETDWELWGNAHGASSVPERPRVTWVRSDLNDKASTAELVERISPAYVFHLAAQSNVEVAFRDPEATITNNVIGELHLLEALRETQPEARVLIIGSSEQYGLVRPEDIPIKEDAPQRPNNPYAVSKIGQDALALQYYLAFGLKTIRVRAFNHIGPNQTEHFVTAAFARQVARIEAGLQEPVIYVGNLDAERDFSDVRDIVRAYYLAITQGDPGEVYNIGSGRSVSIRWLLDTLVGMSTVKVEIVQDPARMRPSDIPILVADTTRFRARTRWRPQVPLETTLRDVLEFWRRKVREQ